VRVEIKAVEVLLPVHKAQLLTYLRLSGLRGVANQLQCAIDQERYHKDGVVKVLSVPLW